MFGLDCSVFPGSAEHRRIPMWSVQR